MGQSLLSLVENTTHDSFELYYGLFLYNPVRSDYTSGPSCSVIRHPVCDTSALHT